MTDLQLYGAIGLPIIVNTAALLLAFTLMSSSLNTRITDLRTELHRDLDTMRADIREIRQDIKLLTGKLYELMDRNEK